MYVSTKSCVFICVVAVARTPIKHSLWPFIKIDDILTKYNNNNNDDDETASNNNREINEQIFKNKKKKI